MTDASTPGPYPIADAPKSVWTLHQGDSRMLSTILGQSLQPAADREPCLDVTITSPPYADLKDYYAGEQEIGRDTDYETYLEDLREIFSQVYALTKESGTLWIVVDDFRDEGRVVPLPQDIIDVCELLDGDTCPSCGSIQRRHSRSGTLYCETCDVETNPAESSWVLKDKIIWNKQKARPWSGGGQFRNAFEYILCFSKSDTPQLYPDAVRIADPAELSHWWVDWPERYHPRGSLPSNIWEFQTHTRGAWGDSKNQHPAAFPPALVARILEYSTTPGDVVFDPFAGSGSVVAQANAMDRRGIGVELNQSFIDAYEQGVRDEIQDDWAARESANEDTKSQQERLARTIWGLRQLVYAKKLCVQLRQTLQKGSVHELGLHSVFVENATAPAEWRTVSEPETEYTFVVTESADETAIEDCIIEAMGEQPWTGFQLQPTLSVKGIDAVSDSVVDSEERYYLYPGSRHWAFSRRMGGSEWVDRSRPVGEWWEAFATTKFPPLLSTRGIRVDRSGDQPEIEDDELLGRPPAESGGESFEIADATQSTTLSAFSQLSSESEQ